MLFRSPVVLKTMSDWILNRNEKTSLVNLKLDSNAKKQVHKCLDLVKEIFGQDLLGVYLYGSSILGGLAKYSDIDLFVVSNRATTLEEKAKLVAALLKNSGIYMKSQALPIEMTIVEKSEINPWHYPPRFDFQYGEWLREQFEHGNIEPWPAKEMPDLALLITQILLASNTLFGLNPDQLLCKVPYKDFMTAITYALPNLMVELDSDTRNVLLTLARIWSTVSTDAIRSKPVAADWVINRLPEKYRPVMRRAKAICKGEEKEHWDDIQERIRPCADFMLSEINNKVTEIVLSENLNRSIKIAYNSITNSLGKFLAKDKSGEQVILEWIKTDMASLEYEKAMKSVWDIACPTYTKVEVDFLRVHPEVVGKEDYFKPFEPLFKNGTSNIAWPLVEEKMQEILKPVFVFDALAFDEDLKKRFYLAEHFFVSVKNEKSDELLGFISFLIIPEYVVGDVKCIAFAVKPEEQNRGLGKLLMSSICKIIPDLKRIFLCTRTTNIIAQKAYFNWGFIKYQVNADINPVFEEHDYTFNLNHWIFLEYKVEQTDILQQAAANFIDSN